MQRPQLPLHPRCHVKKAMFGGGPGVLPTGKGVSGALILGKWSAFTFTGPSHSCCFLFYPRPDFLVGSP